MELLGVVPMRREGGPEAPARGWHDVPGDDPEALELRGGVVVPGDAGVVDGAELAVVVLPEAVPRNGPPPVGAPEGIQLAEVEGARCDPAEDVGPGLSRSKMLSCSGAVS